VAHAGPAVARRDAGGRLACEDCGTRLSRCKGKLYSRPLGKICQLCYNNAIRPHSARVSESCSAPPSPSPLPPPSKKRRVSSDPGESAAPTHSLIAVTVARQLCLIERKESH
jgi:hypothetical protein